MSTISYDTLYHPRYVPSGNWSKMQLLFWDKIYRIVPYDMQNEFGDDYINRVFKIDPSIMPMLEPEASDLRYYDIHKKTLKKAFKKIRKRANCDLKDPQHFFGIHPAKAPKWLFEMLEDLGLAKEIENKKEFWDEKHHWVQKDAGQLIMSCLGSRMASRRGLESTTDRKSSFFLTSANEVSNDQSDRQDSSMEEALAVAVFQFFVPKRIESLSFEQILELQKEYTELRQSFHRAIRTISKEHNLEGIVQKQRAKEVLEDCLQEFIQEHERFKKGKMSRLLGDWRVQSVGVALGGIGATIAGGPLAGLGLTIAGTTLALANSLLNRQEPSRFEQSFHYLHIVNKNLEAQKCVEGIRRYLPSVLLRSNS